LRRNNGLTLSVTRQSTLPSGGLRFFPRPLVGRALLVGGAPALAGDLALPVAVHARETAILSCHYGEPPFGLLCNPCSRTIVSKIFGKMASSSTGLRSLSALAM
jgi:hypothetical protein